MNRFFRLVVLGAVLLAVACGGGGGGGGSGPSYTATYTGPGNTAPGNVVLELNSEGGTLVLDVVVYGPLANVYNIAFRLQYDPAILEYQSASEGAVFDADNCNGGDCTTFTLDSATVSDKLVVGLTRKEPGVGVALGAGANVVMTLTFTPTAEGGPSAFDFVAGTRELKDADGTELSTGWFAGTATVT
ncbi:MAG: hypothetical protein JSV08_07905 [Acidobacteriota bacterium]|nr:MAG: hypothetical protein JSV08_07905 [Acidobacteriota bacterium]